jgi:hypothetical protein
MTHDKDQLPKTCAPVAQDDTTNTLLMQSTKNKKRSRSGSTPHRIDAPLEPESVTRMALMLSDNHPRLVSMAKEMAGFLAACKFTPNDKGTLEIEVSFGCGAHTRFEPTLKPLQAQMVLTACDRGLVQWTEREDEWHIYYDTYVKLPGSKEMVRVRSIDGKDNRNITKTLVARLDLMSVGQQELTMRMQAKVERDVVCMQCNRVLLVAPESVRVSTRRSFLAESSTLIGLKYRYTVIKAWTGRTAKEAEIKMQESKEGMNTVEIESELPWPLQDHSTLVYACLAILMKGQDILELFTGDRSMRKLRFTGYDDVGKALLLRKVRRTQKKPNANINSSDGNSDLDF